MRLNKLTIATRESPLALWQAKTVQAALLAAHPALDITLLPMTTKGDQLLSKSLVELGGGKGLFLKELEQAMLAGKADLAVHSMKDVPHELPPGLGIHAIMQREDAGDAFVSTKFNNWQALPQHAVVGTASLRRATQLQRVRPDLNIKVVRGNVGTRLSKLDAGEYDALILAMAGLIRLELTERITEKFSFDVMLPAVGQGAVGIECRNDARELIELLQSIHHNATAACLHAERSMNKKLNGSCQSSIAAHCIEQEAGYQLSAYVSNLDGSKAITTVATGTDPQQLGEQVADELLQQGAQDLLNDGNTHA